jgi:ABC-type Fe3+-hydroxamate transport system substrate-binding protein
LFSTVGSVPQIPACIFIDDIGKKHAPASEPARIVSLVPSITELLFDLGLESEVVGRTRYCVHPRDKVSSVTAIGGPKSPEVAKLTALSPTHVIAGVDENRRADVDQIATLVPNVIVTDPEAPWDNLKLYRLLGGIFNKRDAAERLCRAFQQGYNSLIEVAASLPPQRVLYLIWRRPWMTVSRQTYISRMLSLARWETVCSNPAERYPKITSPEQLSHTEIVLFSTEPYPFSQSDVNAFRAEFPRSGTRLALVDGEMLCWYGSRAIKGLTYLRTLALTMV